MSSFLNAQTMGIACGIGLIAYCIYFDHKRRSAPDYREKVKAKREQERQRRDKDDEIELPPEGDKVALDRFFVRHIEIGEELLQAGLVDKSVKHLAYAVALCPQPQNLLNYLREVLPTTAYNKLVDLIPYVTKRVKDQYSQSNLQEDDVE